MFFLTPFLIDRETSSNIPRQTLPPPPCTTPDPSQVPEDESQSQLDESLGETQPASSQQAEAGQTGEEEDNVEGRGKRRRGREMSAFEKGLLSAIAPVLSMPLPQPRPVVEEDEDELFLRGLLPSLRRMSMAKKIRLKFAIHKAFFEAEQEED